MQPVAITELCKVTQELIDELKTERDAHERLQEAARPFTGEGGHIPTFHELYDLRAALAAEEGKA